MSMTTLSGGQNVPSVPTLNARGWRVSCGAGGRASDPSRPPRPRAGAAGPIERPGGGHPGDDTTDTGASCEQRKDRALSVETGTEGGREGRKEGSLARARYWLRDYLLSLWQL